MRPLLYDELVPWYHLVDPPEDHREEADCFIRAFERVVSPPRSTLLELGSGAGGNALHMKRRFSCTLSDVSESMLGLSRGLNPECEHVLGDMRSLRLGRVFDVVLVHDAVVYMLSEADLLRAAETAFVHTRPGGAAIFAPDCVRETFTESANHESGRDGARTMEYLDWIWDPDPNDTTYAVEYAFLLREGGAVRAVHDHHVEGLFPRATWTDVLETAGYRVEGLERPLGNGAVDRIFLCRR
jgi:trans-aconitate methyltransferase